MSGAHVESVIPIDKSHHRLGHSGNFLPLRFRLLTRRPMFPAQLSVFLMENVELLAELEKVEIVLRVFLDRECLKQWPQLCVFDDIDDA